MRYVAILLLWIGFCHGATREIRVSNPSGTVLFHYPIEVVITNQINWNEIDPAFSSLRFFEGETPLDFWIEFLDYANHKAVIWIRIPYLTATGTTVYMNYSSVPTDPYTPMSYVAVCPQPAKRLTLKSYPQDSSGGNFSSLHPCVIKAPAGSWISRARTGDSQNVFWLLSDTVMAPDAMVQSLNPVWTRNQTENPALWVCSSPDPSSDSWDWPVGTANWPFSDLGTSFEKALHRVNSMLHPPGTNSNLIAAPNDVSANPWSDPTMIWISSADTLRIYFRYNAWDKPLYYCDITSPVDNAWADANGMSHLTFTYGQCTINGLPYVNSRVSSSGEALSPSVFYSARVGKYVLLTQMFADDGTYRKPIVMLTSNDGLNWTVSKSVVLNNPTGLQGQTWHIGAMEAGDKWFMFGSTSVSMSQRPQPHRIYCWVSEDNGSSWQMQFPACIPKENQFNAGAAYYQTEFDSSYRPWPIWDENGQGFILFCGSVQTGDGISTGALGGLMAIKDAGWSPYAQRPISPINSVFSIMGIDFSEPTAQNITSGALAWPLIARDYANTQTNFTITPDGGCQLLNASKPGILWFVQDFPSHCQVRYRMKTAAADRTANSLATNLRYFAGAKIFTQGSANNLLRIKPYNYQGLISSSPSQLDSPQPVTDPFTISVTSIQSPLAVSKMQILRHDGFDSECLTFVAPSGGLSSGYWPTGQVGNFGIQDSVANKATTLYWAFAKPALINEPVAAVIGFAQGDGSQSNPYQIRSADDWRILTSIPDTWDENFILMSDIDFGGAEISPVAPDMDPCTAGFQGVPFTGVLDGNDHVLMNVDINEPDKDFVGVFGCLGPNGSVRRLAVELSIVAGRSWVGGLCGNNSGAITRCYADTDVTGSEDGNYIGGLCGYNDGGVISQCYSVGAVAGSGLSIGGLCGFNQSGAIDGFWDIQSSGQAASAGGLGLSTFQMMMYSTFIAAGWDFKEFHGSLADWMLLREGEDYPRLAQQAILAGDIAGLYGVDMVDFAELIRNWGKTNCPADCEQADIDGSGTVDMNDLVILAGNWLKGK